MTTNRNPLSFARMLGMAAAGITLSLGLVATSVQAQTVTFDIQYDDSFDDGAGGDTLGNIIGSGTITFDDPGNGDFAFNSITGLNLSINLVGEPFDETDIVFADILLSGIRITDITTHRRLQFIGTGGGTSGGSLDFRNGNNVVLTHEPTGFTGFFNLWGGDAGSGNYLALAPSSNVVPEPGAVAMLAGLGVVGATFAYRRARRK